MPSSAANSSTDEGLVSQFQSGSNREAAFLVLFDRYGALTYAFLRRRIGNPEIARELNQDLYVGVLESLHRFRGECSFKTWLFRLAHHRLSNQRRRWRTHIDELPDAVPEDLSQEIKTPDDERPDEQVDRAEVGRILRKCLAGLTEVERAVIVGQYFEGVTLDELTRNLKLTNKSGARASLLAGQRKLRRCMKSSGVSFED